MKSYFVCSFFFDSRNNDQVNRIVRWLCSCSKSMVLTATLTAVMCDVNERDSLASYSRVERDRESDELLLLGLRTTI